MKCVLVVDDEPSILDLLQSFLREEGFEVLTAPDGIAALEALTRSDVHLVITDTMMPRRGGVELVRSMRERPKMRYIPVIIISAAAKPQLDDLNPATFLAKPFDLTSLLDAIATSVSRLA
jgi:two-component system response regulator MprA